jgi:hypothetical protein
VPGLFLGLGEQLAGFLGIKQVFGAEAGERLGVDSLGRRLQLVGLVVGPAAPVSALDYESHAEPVGGDRLGTCGGAGG